MIAEYILLGMLDPATVTPEPPVVARQQPTNGGGGASQGKAKVKSQSTARFERPTIDITVEYSVCSVDVSTAQFEVRVAAMSTSIADVSAGEIASFDVSTEEKTT